MRTRKEIEQEIEKKGAVPQFILEVLLDIRELLAKFIKNEK
jgi:hypothetical protein